MGDLILGYSGSWSGSWALVHPDAPREWTDLLIIERAPRYFEGQLDLTVMIALVRDHVLKIQEGMVDLAQMARDVGLGVWATIATQQSELLAPRVHTGSPHSRCYKSIGRTNCCSICATDPPVPTGSPGYGHCGATIFMQPPSLCYQASFAEKVIWRTLAGVTSGSPNPVLEAWRPALSRYGSMLV